MATLKYSVGKYKEYEYEFTGTDQEIMTEGIKIQKQFKDFGITRYCIYYAYDNKQQLTLK